jgi:pSer/pThr/pTyr-binding forkhead associated (FHA) protein
MKPPGLKNKIKKNTVSQDDLMEPTANIPAFEKIKSGEEKNQIDVISKSNAVLYCFFKKNDEWSKKKFPPTPFGVKIGKSSDCDIQFDDPDLDDVQIILTEVIDKWIIIDCGKNDLLRVDNLPTRQMSLSSDLPYVIQIGDKGMAVFLTKDSTLEPELIPPVKKLTLKSAGIRISKIKIGDKEQPLHIPDKLNKDESKIIKDIQPSNFILTPLNDLDNLFEKVKIPVSTKEIFVGRSSKKSQIVIKEQSISRQHAKIEVDGKFLYVTDCNTSNGTYLNSNELTDRTLVRSGSVISLGNMPFLVSFE